MKKWPALPKDYNGLLAAVKARDDQICAKLHAWYELGTKFEELADADAKSIAGQPISLPPQWQPIVDFVWMTTKGWQRAANTAPTVFEFAHDFSMLVRESFPYSAAARRFRDISEMVGSNQWDLAHLEQMESRLNKGMAELRWLQKELLNFEALSKEWCAKMVGRPIEVIIKDASALHTFATMVLQWAEVTVCSENRLISARKPMWQVLGGPLDEARSCMRPWYRFGCPRVTGELESLKGGSYCV